MIKLGTVIPYLKKIKKYISRNTDIDCILIHNFYFFYLFVSLSKIKVFRNKDYDFITFV